MERRKNLLKFSSSILWTAFKTELTKAKAREIVKSEKEKSCLEARRKNELLSAMEVEDRERGHRIDDVNKKFDLFKRMEVDDEPAVVGKKIDDGERNRRLETPTKKRKRYMEMEVDCEDAEDYRKEKQAGKVPDEKPRMIHKKTTRKQKKEENQKTGTRLFELMGWKKREEGGKTPSNPQISTVSVKK